MENKENEVFEDQPQENLPVEEPTEFEIQPEEPEVVTEASAVEEPAEEPAPVYHNVGTGRKESPFADSPYVMNRTKTDPTPGYTIPKADKPQKKSHGKFWKKLLAAVLILALVGGSCAATAALVNDYWEDRTEQLEESLEQKLLLMEQALSQQIEDAKNNGNSVSGTATVDGLTPGQVYAQNVRSVVLVYAVVGNQGYSTGSGFILTQDGYVVTNHHVIEGGTSFLVVTSDNVEHEAKLVGSDASNDVAVLKIEGKKYPVVTIGSSNALIVGDQVVAIGNPLGELTSTLTVGYVSGKGRYVATDTSASINMIQTDCAINSGNSGGPLFNMKGEVVGITTAKYSGTSNSGASIEGIGFAIPIDDVMGLVDDILEFGYVNSAYLGIEVNNQNEIQAGLPAGAYVAKVTPGYCAQKAGIRAGDYIVELDGKPVSSMNDLTQILRNLDPGTTTTVVVLRGTQKITLEITLDARPRDTEQGGSAEVPLPQEGNYDEWYEYFRWFFENQGKDQD